MNRIVDITQNLRNPYRFGFNGKEKDDETYGAGCEYDFGARIYDPRVGRWNKCDTKEDKYIGWSPYHFGYCNPIIVIDPNGKENIVVVGNANDPANGRINPYSQNILMAGLNEALRLKNERTTASEETMLIIYRGAYSEKDITNITNKATESNIKFMIVDNVTEITGYVNDKNGGRGNDLISDFSYVGHGSSESLLVGYPINKDGISGSDFESSSFNNESQANLISCHSAFIYNPDNITNYFAKRLIGDKAQGAPGDVFFGQPGPGKEAEPGTYWYQDQGWESATEPINVPSQRIFKMQEKKIPEISDSQSLPSTLTKR